MKKIIEPRVVGAGVGALGARVGDSVGDVVGEAVGSLGAAVGDEVGDEVGGPVVGELVGGVGETDGEAVYCMLLGKRATGIDTAHADMTIVNKNRMTWAQSAVFMIVIMSSS